MNTVRTIFVFVADAKTPLHMVQWDRVILVILVHLRSRVYP